MNWQPGKQPIMGGHRIAERLADLERQVAELKKAIQISPAEIVIKSQGGVKIEAMTGVTLKATTGVDIEAAAGTVIKAANIKLDASLLTLPGGTRPIVRVGDLTAGGPGAGTITGPGNPTVLG